MHHESDPALQGTALVLTGMVQSQEQYLALLSHLLPVRLHWNGDCAAGPFSSSQTVTGVSKCDRRGLFPAWLDVGLSIHTEDPCSSNSHCS